MKSDKTVGKMVSLNWPKEKEPFEMLDNKLKQTVHIEFSAQISWFLACECVSDEGDDLSSWTIEKKYEQLNKNPKFQCLALFTNHHQPFGGCLSFYISVVSLMQMMQITSFNDVISHTI